MGGKKTFWIANSIGSDQTCNYRHHHSHGWSEASGDSVVQQKLNPKVFLWSIDMPAFFVKEGHLFMRHVVHFLWVVQWTGSKDQRIMSAWWSRIISELPILEETRRSVTSWNVAKLPEFKPSTLKCSRSGSSCPPVVAHSVVFYLQHWDHPDWLKAGSCHSNLEWKGWHPGLWGEVLAKILLEVPAKSC